MLVEYAQIGHNAIKQTSFGGNYCVRAIGQGKIVLRVCVSVSFLKFYFINWLE
jgi:hypothetical protein